MRTLTIKGRITLLYALLTALLPAVLLPVVYGAVSASLRREMDSQLRSAIAQVLIAVDDQDETFRLNQQVDLPDAITLCVTDPQGQPIFSTAGGEWLQTAAIQPDGKTVHQNETYTVRQETVQIEGATVTASAAISAGSAEASLHTLQVLLGILVPIYRRRVSPGQTGHPPHHRDHQGRGNHSGRRPVPAHHRHCHPR